MRAASPYPLTLRRSAISRVFKRRPVALILPSKPQLETYAVHDQLVLRRNTQRRKLGRHDLLEDPLVFTVQIQSVATVGLVELDQLLVRRAGFPTTEDFFLDWLSTRRRIDTRAEVYVCGFQLVEDALFLHARVARGYTSDPARAARGEPQAVGQGELEKLASAGRERFEEMRSDEHRRRAVKSLANRLRDAGRRLDADAVAAVREDLGMLETALRTNGGTTVAYSLG